MKFASRRNKDGDLSGAEFDRLLVIAARLGLVFLALVAATVVLGSAKAILAPISLAIVVGLVFGPIADALEARGIPPALSAGLVVVLLLVVLGGSVALFAVPLSEWAGRAPMIWQKLQAELVNWREPLEALGAMQDQFKSALGGGDALTVTVENNTQFLDVALIAPAILGDILMFLVGLYFYLATRDSIRVAVLSVCVTRRLRWRTAHVFRQVEQKVSRFLLAVTLLNVCVGLAVAGFTYALGLPSPLLWGALAFVLNYIPYVGQAVMVVVLASVGLATQTGVGAILAPVGLYLLINLVEGQVAFPHLVGKTMTLNPFLIFLSIIFWIWIWGPVGSLMAVPSLLILQSVVLNIVPTRDVKPMRPVRRTAAMTDRDMVLANAARAIREKQEAEAKAKADAEAAAAKAVEDEARAKAAKAKEARDAKEAKEAKAQPAPRRPRRSPRPKATGKPAVAT